MVKRHSQGSTLSGVTARYADTGELCLDGTRASLTELARTIESEPLRLALDVPVGVAPTPYTGYIHSIVVAESEGKVRIRRTGDTLYVEGNRKSRLMLAQNIEALELTEHAHLDHFPGHPFLDELSQPIVVECDEQGA
jgi:hypothetical protein